MFRMVGRECALGGDPLGFGEGVEVRGDPADAATVAGGPIPPNGTVASSPTVWSLMCTRPAGIRCAISRPFMASAVRMLRDRPYSVLLAIAMASSMVSNAATGATGPNTSLANAGACSGVWARTVGR